MIPVGVEAERNINVATTRIDKCSNVCAPRFAAGLKKCHYPNQNEIQI